MCNSGIVRRGFCSRGVEGRKSSRSIAGQLDPYFPGELKALIEMLLRARKEYKLEVGIVSW